MAVTLNTIPAETGELVRALITIGDPGSSGTVNLYTSRGDGVGSISDDSDMVIDGANITIDQLRISHGGMQLIFNRSGSGAYNAATAEGGALHGKFITVAFDDVLPHEVQYAVEDPAVMPAVGALRVALTTHQYNQLVALEAGDQINLVIGDGPPVRETAADVTAGAASAEAEAERVEAAVHDTAADVTAGAAGVDAAVERAEAGVHETAADVDAGAPAVTADAQLVIPPTTDTAADVAGGAAGVEADAAEVAAVVHDVDADVEAGAPAAGAIGESLDASTREAGVVSVDGAAPAVTVSADKIAVHDVAPGVEAGAPGVEAIGELVDATANELIGDVAGSAPSVGAAVVTIKSSRVEGVVAEVADRIRTLWADALVIEGATPTTGPDDPARVVAVSVGGSDATDPTTRMGLEYRIVCACLVDYEDLRALKAAVLGPARGQLAAAGASERKRLTDMVTFGGRTAGLWVVGEEQTDPEEGAGGDRRWDVTFGFRVAGVS